jgi:hypothetical protein
MLQPSRPPEFDTNIWWGMQWRSWQRPCVRLRLKCDSTHAETRFRLSAKRTSPIKSSGASVQSTAGSRGVRISGSNAGYTTFRGSVTVLATHSIHRFPLQFPSCASSCAITFQPDSTSQKLAEVYITDGVTGIFYWPNPSSRTYSHTTYVTGVDSASNRNEYQGCLLGVKTADALGWQPWNSGSLDLLQPYGSAQTCIGIALPFNNIWRSDKIKDFAHCPVTLNSLEGIMAKLSQYLHTTQSELNPPTSRYLVSFALWSL